MAGLFCIFGPKTAKNIMNKPQFFILALCLFLLGSCQSYQHFVKEEGQYYPLNSQEHQQADSSIANIYAPYKKQLEAQMNEQLGQLSVDLIKEQPESNMGNFAADMVAIQAQAYTGKSIDFAVLNYGGLRLPSIPKGPLKKGKIYELMPFDNMIVVMEMKGSELRPLFEHICMKGGWPISSAVRMEIDDEFAPQNIRLEGQAIQADKKYRIATIDYLANGGDNCTFFKGKKRYETGKFLRDAAIEYISAQTAKGKSIKARKEGRISQKK